MQYIPAKNHGGATNQPVRWVVIHGTVTPCDFGWAKRVAYMFANTSRDASTQKVHDPGTSIRCVPDGVVAYGAPPNTGSVHHELCDPQKGSGARWQDALHQAMIRLCAKDVAADCTRYRIPVRRLTAADRRRGMRGILGHKEVSDAFHLTDHVDPGPDFPWSQFLALVKQYQKNPNVPPAQGDDDVPVPVTASVHNVQPVAVAPAWKVLGLRNTDDAGAMSPSIVAGPARVEGTITIYLDRVPSGLVVVNAYQAGVVDGVMKLIDTAGTASFGGTDKLQFHVSRTIPAGRLLRARIQCAEDGVQVTYVHCDLSTWKV